MSITPYPLISLSPILQGASISLVFGANIYFWYFSTYIFIFSIGNLEKGSESSKALANTSISLEVAPFEPSINYSLLVPSTFPSGLLIAIGIGYAKFGGVMKGDYPI